MTGLPTPQPWLPWRSNSRFARNRIASNTRLVKRVRWTLAGANYALLMPFHCKRNTPLSAIRLFRHKFFGRGIYVSCAVKLVCIGFARIVNFPTSTPSFIHHKGFCSWWRHWRLQTADALPWCNRCWDVIRYCDVTISALETRYTGILNKSILAPLFSFALVVHLTACDVRW